MNRSASLHLFFVLTSAAIVAVGGAGATRADELPLKRVVLSSSGLAQFTHFGPVDGASNIDLRVRLDQVDDILKSLTIFDRPGAIGAISLPGKTPISELFRDLPFDQDAFTSRAALLKALVGSEVELAGSVVAKGLLFRVEDEVAVLPNNGGTTTRHRITVLTDKGLVQALLEDVSELRFTDPKINAQLNTALKGMIANRAKDSRQLSISFRGEGPRNVGFSYVVAAPIWKTSYRLVLPKQDGKARLQGWAVVENLTGGDWKDVELTLVSGNPVALRQPLYTAFYASRPEIPVGTRGRLVPRVDSAPDGLPLPRQQAMLPAPPPGLMGKREMEFADSAGSRGVARLNAPTAEPTLLGGAANAADAEDAGTQLLYRFPVAINLAAGSTMMVPFVDREVQATRVWLYQPETSATHPLATVRVQNDGDSGFPAGIVTAYETSGDGKTDFVGDAQLPLLSKNASKFVTFALDNKTDIHRDDRGVRAIRLGKMVNGTLTVTTKSSRSIAYEVTPPSDEDRLIVVEEARANGWKPAADIKDLEETPTLYRYSINAPKGRKTTGTLTTERVDDESIVLTGMAADDMLVSLRGLQNDSGALKKAIGQLSDLTNDISKLKTRRTALEDERSTITEDQERIRANLQSVGQSSDLGRRYIADLKAQEDRLSQIASATKDIGAQLDARQKQAEDLVRGLAL